MRDISLLIVTLGAVLVNICSCKAQSLENNDGDEPLRMASDSLVVKSYAEDEDNGKAEDEDAFRTYQGVMGRPGIDFPVYRNIPATSFSCRDVKRPGYYADLATDCQVFHICDGGRKISFLCPNGTIFRQSHLICDWWFRVDCGKSVELYEESAEQLAADQKLYKERSIERERRKKLGKKLQGDEEDSTGGEVFALDEPYNVKARDNYYREEGPRNSKRVQDRPHRGPAGKYNGQRRGKGNGRAQYSDGGTGDFPRDNYNRAQGIPARSNDQKSNQAFSSFPAEPYPTQSYEPRDKQIRTGGFQENIEGAESGSLVGNLRNSIRNENSIHLSKKLPGPRPQYQEAPPSTVTPFSSTTESWSPDSQWQTTVGSDNPDNFYGTTVRHDSVPGISEISGTTDNYYSISTERYQSKDSLKYLPTTGPPQTYNAEGSYVEQGVRADNKPPAEQTPTLFTDDRSHTEQPQGPTAFNEEKSYTQQSQVANVLNNDKSFSGHLQNANQYNNDGNDKSYTEQPRGPTAYTDEKLFTEPTQGADVYNNVKSYTEQPLNTYTNQYNEKSYTEQPLNTYTNQYNNEKSYTEQPQALTQYSNGGPNTEQPQSTSAYSNENAYAEQTQGGRVNGDTSYSQQPGDSGLFIGDNSFPGQTREANVYNNEKSYSELQQPAGAFNPEKSYTNQTENSGVYSSDTYTKQPELTVAFNADKSFTDQSPQFNSSYPPIREIATTELPPELGRDENSPEGPATTERIPPEDIYLTTTSLPETDPEINSPRVDITLHQVRINRPSPQKKEKSISYEDVVREGLEVPPSSGPNALRSFALYFAGKSSSPSVENRTQKDLFYIPTVGEDDQKSSTYEERKNDVVKLVDNIIKDNTAGGGDEASAAAGALPNSLTQHTKDLFAALFNKNRTEAPGNDHNATESEYETTAFEAFTENPEKINIELRKNDLDSSQSRGLVEAEPQGNHLNDDFSKVSPDLRELAQVFTKALSAYLDDPESFRKILSEIRPTEPAATETPTTQTEYPSVTQEDDEVLDFSDVTKSSYRHKTTTVAYRETTTEYATEPPTTTVTQNKDLENLVLPLRAGDNLASVKLPGVELTAPLLEGESLDESQSSYYTSPSRIAATTNTIAEEINREFAVGGDQPAAESNGTVDSYLPIRGSAGDETFPRYGGFQNNTKSTKYVPYGADLTSTTAYVPYGADLTTTTTTEGNANDATTFNPRKISASIRYRKPPEAVIKAGSGGEAALAEELNNLAVKEARAPIVVPPLPHGFQSVNLGNGETLERTVTRSSTSQPTTTTTTTEEPLQHLGLNIELSPPFESDTGYYEFHSVLSSAPETPGTTVSFQTSETQRSTEPVPSTTFPPTSEATDARSIQEEEQTVPPTTTPQSFQRIAELQQTLMFSSDNVTNQQMETAKATVAETMERVNMTETTADTLMKVMEMAAKNETYRRLVLLLVNDRSGRNKTVEETRLALLRALLTPVISTSRSRLGTLATATTPIDPITAPSVTTRDGARRGNFRRSKSISGDSTRNVVRLTTEVPAQRTRNGRRMKLKVVSRVVEATDAPERLDLIKQTAGYSKSKSNSANDAILNSDSRAVELLRSLYSLAARWG